VSFTAQNGGGAISSSLEGECALQIEPGAGLLSGSITVPLGGKSALFNGAFSTARVIHRRIKILSVTNWKCDEFLLLQPLDVGNEENQK